MSLSDLDEFCLCSLRPSDVDDNPRCIRRFLFEEDLRDFDVWSLNDKDLDDDCFFGWKSNEAIASLPFPDALDGTWTPSIRAFDDEGFELFGLLRRGDFGTPETFREDDDADSLEADDVLVLLLRRLDLDFSFSSRFMTSTLSSGDLDCRLELLPLPLLLLLLGRSSNDRFFLGGPFSFLLSLICLSVCDNMELLRGFCAVEGPSLLLRCDDERGLATILLCSFLRGIFKISRISCSPSTRSCIISSPGVILLCLNESISALVPFERFCRHAPLSFFD